MADFTYIRENQEVIISGEIFSSERTKKIIRNTAYQKKIQFIQSSEVSFLS